MPTYKKCTPTNNGDSVLKIAKLLTAMLSALGGEYEHIEKVKVDYLFAFPDFSENGMPKNNAISFRGKRALGLCRIVNLKDRAKGNGDVEILIDADNWEKIPEAEQRALLDHELNHIQVCLTKNGKLKTDDLDRPKLRMRKHDVEFGWFSVVAKRHGQNSIEQIQARELLTEKGQFFWPAIVSDALPAKRLNP